MEFTGERYLPNSQDKTMEVEHLQRYASIIPLVRDKVVIDAACGEGYGSNLLSNYAKEVIGVDISEEAITHAKATYMNSNIRFMMSSVEMMDIPSSSADVIVSFETIEHINAEMQHLFMKEIKRILKEEGILIISTPDRRQYSDLRNYNNPFHVKEFYKQEFRDFLKSYFNSIEFYYQKFEIVSLMVNQKSDLVQNIELEDKEDQENDGMYIIAVCSNQRELNKSIDSYTVSKGLKYSQLTERINSLQGEVEERNKHIRKLDEDIKYTGERIVMLQNEVEERNKHIDHLDKIIENNYSTIDQLENEHENRMKELENEHENRMKELEGIHYNKELKLKELEVGYLNDIHNKEAHINLLLEEERKLQAIYHSGGWRVLSRYYRVRDYLIPNGSRRRFMLKMVIRILKNPKNMMKHINKDNIKKFKRYLKTDDINMLDSRVENYLERHTRTNSSKEITLMNHIDLSEKLVFHPFESPLVSIIIPVYNQWHYTYSCLASILEHTNDVLYEIIIADDVSTDDTIHIKDVVQNIKVVRDEVNRGFLLNCNNAAKHAKGKYILFLNNDTNVQEGWLSSLVDLIESDHQIGMVGSKLVYPDGRLQEAGGIIWGDASGWNYGRLDDPEKSEFNYVKEVDYISGAAIMIRRDLWEVIGGFDERYVPAYYEDSDLAFEVRRQGYKVMFQPKSVVVHFEGISHGTDTGTGVKSYQVANNQKFLNKWEDILQKNHFPNAEHVFWAKDRSSTKKTVVVVDHYVPHYDKDAGGRCVYQYLKLFVDCGYHVIFIGDNFFKHEPYTSHLEQMGIQVLYGNWYAKHIEDWIKQNKAYIDFVYLNRPHISIKYIDVFRKYTNAKIIYFGHDLHYLREMRNYEIDPNPELLKSSEKWKGIEFELFQKADTIYTVGSYEQEVLMKEFSNKPIRNIPLYFYDQDAVDVLKPGFDGRKDLLFVGGFNHKPNLDAVMWFVKEVFPIILQTKPEIKIYIVGSNPPQEIMDLKSKHIIVTGFVSDEELQKYYDTCKVVVVPLRFGAGVKGKVVEALANNVPIVTTSIGAEGLAGIEDSVKIATDVNDYIANVIALYDDRLEWERLSGNSRQYIAQNFSSYAAKSIILHDFK